MWSLPSVIAARVFNIANNASTIYGETFGIAIAADVIASPCWALPVPGRATAGIELDLQLGYGANAADVPDPLRHAVRMLVAHWYENRGLVAAGTVAVLPAGVDALIAPYRVRAL